MNKRKPLTFEKYQKRSRKTAVYPNIGGNYIYPTLGLAGETGEIAEKVSKIIRDSGGDINELDKHYLAKEMGDVLWYLSILASELGLELNKIAEMNLQKLSSRKKRGKLHGSGDNR